MARPKIAAGGVGQVQVTQLTNGKWRARARMRNDSGELVQLRAKGATEDAAREELLSRAKTMRTHTKAIATAGSTIAEAAEAWLPTVKVCAENGTLSWSTYENYETTVRLTPSSPSAVASRWRLSRSAAATGASRTFSPTGACPQRGRRVRCCRSSVGSPCATTRSRRTRARRHPTADTGEDRDAHPAADRGDPRSYDALA